MNISTSSILAIQHWITPDDEIDWSVETFDSTGLYIILNITRVATETRLLHQVALNKVTSQIV